MKAFKILLWLAISFAFGKGLNYLLGPSESLYSILLFVIPFIIMGFQQEIKTKKDTTTIFGKTIYTTTQEYKVLLFWGIPLGQAEMGEIKNEYLPGITPQEVLQATNIVFETLVVLAVKGFFKGATSASKDLPSSE